MSNTSSDSTFEAFCQFPLENSVQTKFGLLTSRISFLQGSNQATAELILQDGDNQETKLILDETLSLDDHNIPSIIVLSEDIALVGYTDHDRDRNLRLLQVKIGGAQLQILRSTSQEMPASTTYLYFALLDQNRILVVSRSIDMKPTAFWYDWVENSATEPFVLFPVTTADSKSWQSGRDGKRPYLLIRRYYEKAYFALTEDHPRAFRNGIYAGYMTKDGIYDLDGKFCTPLESSVWNPTKCLTMLVPPGQFDIPWVWDVRSYGNQISVAYSWARRPDYLFKTTQESVALDYGYRVAEYKSGHIKIKDFGFAGKPLSPYEGDYVGGISLHPLDPEVAVISSSVDPKDGRELSDKTHAIYIVRNDDNRSFYRAIIESLHNSDIRPRYTEFSPKGFQLLYMSGKYEHCTRFFTSIKIIGFVPGISSFSVRNRTYDLPWNLSTDSDLPQVIVEDLKVSLSKSKKYFEWGAGTSTLLAFEFAAGNVVSVDNDLELLKILDSFPRASSGDYTQIRALRGTKTLRSWGYWSTSPTLANEALEYATAFKSHSDSDLILIDGRFRALCFLTVISSISQPTKIFFDDYRARGYYHYLESYVSPSHYVGRAAVFQLESAIRVKTEDLITAAKDIR